MEFVVFFLGVHLLFLKNLPRIVSIQNERRNAMRKYTMRHNLFMNFFIKSEQPKIVKRKQVISLTTSPSRIQQIKKVLFNFRVSQQDRVILNLPDKFRNVESYSESDLTKLQKSCPKLVLNWCGADTGPEMKLLGCLPVTRNDEYILVIDDDTLQNNSLIGDQDDALDLCEKELDGPQLLTPSAETIQGVQIQPGQCSFCVPRRMIPDNFKEIVAKQKAAHKLCNFHDDFTMGAAFQDARFVRIQTSTGMPQQLPHGFGGDALHMQSMSFIKHMVCADSIFQSREMCPLQEPTWMDQAKRRLIQYLN